MSRFSESTVEDVALERFGELRYGTRFGSDITPGELAGEHIIGRNA